MNKDNQKPRKKKTSPPEEMTTEEMLRLLSQGREELARRKRNNDDEVREFAIASVEELVGHAEELGEIIAANPAGAFIQAPFFTMMATFEFMLEALTVDEEDLEELSDMGKFYHEAYLNQLITYFRSALFEASNWE